MSHKTILIPWKDKKTNKLAFFWTIHVIFHFPGRAAASATPSAQNLLNMFLNKFSTYLFMLEYGI